MTLLKVLICLDKKTPKMNLENDAYSAFLEATEID